MRPVFDQSVMNQSSNTFQSAADYATELRILASENGWNETGQMTAFVCRLSDVLQHQLLTWNETESLWAVNLLSDSDWHSHQRMPAERQTCSPFFQSCHCSYFGRPALPKHWDACCPLERTNATKSAEPASPRRNMTGGLRGIFALCVEIGSITVPTPLEKSPCATTNATTNATLWIHRDQ